MPIVLLVVFLAVLQATPVFAQQIRAEDLATFVDRSGGQHRPAVEGDLESLLHEIGKRQPDPEAAVAQFAKRLGVSIEVANGYAATLIESLTDPGCLGGPEGCAFAPGEPLYRLIERAASLDDSGRLLAAVARNLTNTGIDRGASAAAFVTFVAAHPRSHVVFRSLLDWTERPLYLAALLASMARLDEPGALADIVAASTPDSDEPPGWIDAMLEDVADDPKRVTSPAARATIAQAAILRKLRYGLDAAALEQYDGLAPKIRALLPQPFLPQLRGACAREPRACERLAHAAYRFVDDVSAALALAGRRKDALALLNRRLVGIGTRSPEDKRRHEAILEALRSTRRRDDLFDLYIRGHLRGRSSRNRDSFAGGLEGPGWLFAIDGASPAVQRLAADHLRAAGYLDMAASLGQVPEIHDRLEHGDAFEAVASRFPPRVRERRTYWERRIRAAMTPGRPPRGSTPSRVSRREVSPWWVERPLPAGIEPWSDSAPRVTADSSPDRRYDVQLPVDPDAVLRFEHVGDEVAVVYESSDYDLPGEIPALGLWFVQTSGGKWGRPIYLGLQQHYPYVVTPGSRLPLLDGTLLRVEVQVREIDAATITFPPIGLGLARSADGIYLEMDIARLQMDADGDGMPDIEERRIGLDADNPDTDGDSLNDGSDPLPLTPFSARGFGASGLAHAILSQVTGHDAKAIVVPVAGGNRPLAVFEAGGAARGYSVRTPAGAEFLVADPELFSGVVTSKRLVIYSDADIAELRRGAAPFYPPRIGPIFSSLDGRTHYVSWSAQWTGGAFIVTCDASDTCSVEMLSSWIT